MTKKFMTVGIVLLFIGTCIIPGIAQKIEKAYVGGTGPGNYSTIQEAINTSMDGDTIFVFDDKSPYVESIFINKSIQLLGENKKTTVINGNSDIIVIQILNCSQVTIQGFTIRNALQTLIDINSCKNCLLSDNILLSHYTCGIIIEQCNNIQIIKNLILFTSYNLVTNSQESIIANNKILFGLTGFELRSNYNTSMYNNTIKFMSWQGILLSGSFFCEFNGNTIEQCSKGVEFGGGTNLTFNFNRFRNNLVGIHFCSSGGITINSNEIKGNLIGILLVSLKGNISYNNFIRNVCNILIPCVGYDYNFSNNYWNHPRNSPKAILAWRLLMLIEPGTFFYYGPGLFIPIPKLLFDLHPAQEPYDPPRIT